MINGILSHQTVYVWDREFDRAFVCACDDPPAEGNVWVGGNVEFYQFRLVGELDDELRVGPIGQGVPPDLRPAFDVVAGAQGADDPTLWWGPSAQPNVQTPPPAVEPPGSDNEPNVGGVILAKPRSVDCQHHTIKLPDGSTVDFTPANPSTVDEPPHAPAPLPTPWDPKYDPCCMALRPEDHVAKVELVDSDSCIFKEAGTW